jgi:hypothetical protein
LKNVLPAADAASRTTEAFLRALETSVEEGPGVAESKWRLDAVEHVRPDRVALLAPQCWGNGKRVMTSESEWLLSAS